MVQLPTTVSFACMRLEMRQEVHLVKNKICLQLTSCLTALPMGFQKQRSSSYRRDLARRTAPNNQANAEPQPSNRGWFSICWLIGFSQRCHRTPASVGESDDGPVWSASHQLGTLFPSLLIIQGCHSWERRENGVIEHLSWDMTPRLPTRNRVSTSPQSNFEQSRSRVRSLSCLLEVSAKIQMQ